MKRIVLLLAALWIFIAAVTPESLFAAQLYEKIYGKPPPPPKQWEIVVHEQDGTQPLYRVNRKNKTVDIYLHEGQRRAWDSDRRFVFMIAGKQSGKTIFGPLWLFREIIERGAGDYLAISATADLFIAKMMPALKQFFINELGIAKYWAGDRVLELCDLDTGKFGAANASDHEKMWGRIILRTAESEAGMQSFSAKAAWMDEPGLYVSTVYKDVRGRLSLAAGPALGTTTPYDMGWLKKDIFDLWEKGDPEIDVINFVSTVNPFFSQAEYESLQRTMQPYQFALDYKASFGRPPAAIYDNFVDAITNGDIRGHKCKRFVIPQEWPRQVGIDPGIVNPGKIWFAEDVANKTFYAYRAEKGGKRRDAKEHARDDLKLAKDSLERVMWWAIGAKGGEDKYWREDYKAAGALAVREPDTVHVEEGIDRVYQLIGEYRIIIFDDLTDLISEIMSYSREIKNGEVTEKIKDKTTFHLIDALRYFAVQVVKKRSKWKIEEEISKYA